jgi:hypothetical protein
VVEGCEDRTKAAEGSEASRVFLGEQMILTPTFRAGVDGLRALVDQAAERVEGEAVDGDDRKALRVVLDVLKGVAQAAVSNSCHVVRVYVTDVNHTSVSRQTVFAAARAVEALLAAQPSKPEPAEPTLEECVAAINRACHRQSAGWRIIADGSTDNTLNEDEIRALGAYYIERERAAKGGA